MAQVSRSAGAEGEQARGRGIGGSARRVLHLAPCPWSARSQARRRDGYPSQLVHVGPHPGRHQPTDLPSVVVRIFAVIMGYERGLTVRGLVPGVGWPVARYGHASADQPGARGATRGRDIDELSAMVHLRRCLVFELCFTAVDPVRPDVVGVPVAGRAIAGRECTSFVALAECVAQRGAGARRPGASSLCPARSESGSHRKPGGGLRWR